MYFFSEYGGEYQKGEAKGIENSEPVWRAGVRGARWAGGGGCCLMIASSVSHEEAGAPGILTLKGFLEFTLCPVSHTVLGWTIYILV